MTKDDRESLLTAEEARKLFYIDGPDLRWRISRTNRIAIGQIAGAVTAKGYLRIEILTPAGIRNYSVHRVVWLMTRGTWPTHQIDHIDRNVANNDPSNLREATTSQNCCNRKVNANNSSGVKGVSWLRGKWLARIKLGSASHTIGLFDSIQEAALARKRALEELHGEFAFMPMPSKPENS